MSTETRHSRRFKIDEICTIIFAHDRSITSKAVNISAGGIYVAVENGIDIGTGVYITLSSECGCSEKVIRAEGVVTRSLKGIKDYFIAIHFTNIDGDEIKAIEDLDAVML